MAKYTYSGVIKSEDKIETYNEQFQRAGVLTMVCAFSIINLNKSDKNNYIADNQNHRRNCKVD